MIRKNGFSLIELMVAVLILGVITAASANLFINLSMQNKFLETSLESTELRNDVSRVLQNPALCSTVIGGKSFSLDPAATTPLALSNPIFADPSGGQTLQAGTRYKNLMVQSFNLVTVQLEKDNPSPSDPDIYSGVARMIFLKLGQSLGSKTSNQIDVALYFASNDGIVVNPSGCLNAEEVNPRKACEAISGIWIQGTSQCDLCTPLGGTFNPVAGTCNTCTSVGGTIAPNGTCDMCSSFGWTRDGAGTCVPVTGTPPIVTPPVVTPAVNPNDIACFRLRLRSCSPGPSCNESNASSLGFDYYPTAAACNTVANSLTPPIGGAYLCRPVRFSNPLSSNCP